MGRASLLAGDVGIAVHCIGVQTQPPRDEVRSETLVLEVVDLLPPGAGVGLPPRRWLWHRRLRRRWRELGRAQAAAVLGDGFLDVVAEVVVQVPSVRDLRHAGQGAVGAFGVAATAVTADHSDAWMRPQPPRKGFGVAVG
jgi:hypothetical protein